MSESVLYRRIDEWRTALPYPPSDGQIARRIGVSPQVFSKWRYGTAPKPAPLRALAEETGIPYRELLDAVLTDMGYLP